MSLRRRLVLGLVMIGAVLVATNVTLSSRFERFLVERVDRQLTDVASSRLFREERPRRAGPPARGPHADDQTVSEYFIAVADPETGRMARVGSRLGDERPTPVLDAASLRARAAPPERARPFTVPAESGGGAWRLVAVRSGPRALAVVGLSLDEVDSTAQRIRVVQVLGTLAVLSTLALVTWWVVRLGVHPIEDMATTADAIAAGDLARRVEHPGAGTETGRLGIAFNAMLERIQVAFREREASEERVRTFAADASHELRTPLTSILGYAELWRAGGLRGEGQLGDAMARIEQEGHRMAALVEDLLLLARLDQGRSPDRSAVRLDRLVDEAVADARAVEPDRPLRVHVEPVVVPGDELQLRQVVGNLLANARVHTPRGTPVHVSVGLAPGGELAVLEVADEGPGMPAEVAARVFDRFFRGDASRGRSAGAPTGSGLGLAIVQGVAAGHGGRASVTSTPGQGSRFVVELPAAPPDA